MMARTVAFGALFFYLYSINLSAIPLGVGTRVYMSLAGCTLMLLQSTIGSGVSFLTKDFGKIIAALMMVPAISIIAILANQTADLEFVKYPISMLLIFAAAYFVRFVFVFAFPSSYQKNLVYIFIGCVALQCVLAVVMFASPGIKELLLSVVSASDVEAEQISSTGEFRLLGFGSNFFGSGITNGMALMLICFCVRHYAGSRLAAFFFGLAYLLIALVGILMSRTTVVGVVLSIAYLHGMLYFRATYQLSVNYRPFMTALALSILFALSLFFVLVDFSIVEPMLNWAFEPLINYFSGDGLKSQSTDQLADMYTGSNLAKLPWFIGDAMFRDPFVQDLYYMHVDVGYMRLIYYFGLPGLTAYLVFQVRTIFSTLQFFRDDHTFAYLASAYLLLLNFKGFTDLFVFFALFFMMQLKMVSLRETENVNSNAVDFEAR
jgi:hypothetical protein